MLGVLQEQHPERARLFAQWKKLDFPLLADPLNLLDVAVVPITLLVDQYGVIRYRNPSGADFDAFVNATYEPLVGKHPKLSGAEWSKPDQQVMMGKVEEGINAYQKILEKNPRAGRLHFRLGVAYRMAYDVNNRPKDFAKAVEHWRKARSINGGQYIWRRRIQQYGPLPDKPYPFYDWVAKAQEEIVRRGEKPVSLKVKLSVSEKAHKATRVKAGGLTAKPEVKGIAVDKDNIEIQPVVLPATSGKQSVYRVHLLLKPTVGAKYMWNNEAGPVKIWLEKGEGDDVDQQGMEIPLKTNKPTGSETRSIEFEWRAGKNRQLKGFAIYHVCDKTSGQCSILTQRFTVSP